MNPLVELQNALPLALLVLVRASTMFMLMPIFGSGIVPPPAKIGFAFLVTVVVLPLLRPVSPPIPGDWGGFLLALGGELATGAILGFATQLLFEGASLAGELIGIQMGFGMAQIFNPQAERQIALIGQFYFLIASFVFFAINGHHWLVAAFWRSFKHVPVGSFAPTALIVTRIVEMASQIFLTAFVLAIPIWGILALVDLVLAIIGQSMPQMQIFVLGMPVKIVLGLLTVMFSLQLIGEYLQTAMGRMLGMILRLI